MANILIVEDDVSYIETLKKVLEDNDYSVDYTNDPIQALEFVSTKPFDLILSDLHMNVVNGLRFAKSAKRIQPEIKIMILTGFPDEATEIEAIDSDIDAYLPKEKGMNIILKYVEQTLKKKTVIDSERNKILVSQLEGIRLDKRKHEVYKEEERIELTPKEFNILELFLENKRVTLTRLEIIEKIWGSDLNEIDERSVDAHIKNLREKIRVHSIISVRGLGYKWNE